MIKKIQILLSKTTQFLFQFLKSIFELTLTVNLWFLKKCRRIIFFLHKELIHLFEPQKLCVKKFSCYALIETENVYKIEKLFESNTKTKMYSVREAQDLYYSVVSEFKNKNTSSNFLPIFCIERFDLSIEGIQAVLLDNLSGEIEQEFIDLKLKDPVTIRTIDRGDVVKGFIDFLPDKILLYGEPSKILVFLKTTLQRFDLNLSEYSIMRQKLRDLFNNYFNEPLGSRSIIGAFGVIFTVVLGFLVNKIIVDKVKIQLLFSLFFSLSPFLTFMLLEAYENRIVAISPNWIRWVSRISWLLFLSFIIFGSIFFLSAINVFYLVIITQFIAVIIVVLGIIKTFGEVLFEAGLSKNILILLWFFLLIANLLFINEILIAYHYF